MRTRLLATGLALATLVGALPATAEAQLVDRLKRAAEQTVENEAARQMQRLLREAIRCAIDDPACPAAARQDDEEKEVIYTDANGEVIVDDEGVPITDREAAAARAGHDISAEAAPESEFVRPGEGLWANYDFVPGETVLFYDDFSNDRVGDFPRRFEFIEGTWEIVESADKRYLRATSAGLVKIPLAEELPLRFTVEFDVNTTHGNSSVYLTPGPAIHGPDRSYQGSAAVVRSTQAGLQPVGDAGPRSMTLYQEDFLMEFRNESTPKPLRFMADGEYVKMYLDEHRVANVPNAVFPRSNALYIAVSSVTPETPALIGPVRIAAGGAELYDRLSTDGRVATQGILFAVNSATIRPESTPTLEEIGTMLQDHPELRIRIEGHTDSTGDDAHNQTLSEERAASVRDFLVEEYGIDASRLESQGFGEASPADTNDTPEGRQNNRRVELVRLDG